MRTWLKDFIHNSLVHPMLPFMSVSKADAFHDRNANWAFGRNRYDERKLEHDLSKENPI